MSHSSDTSLVLKAVIYMNQSKSNNNSKKVFSLCSEYTGMQISYYGYLLLIIESS